MSSDDSTRNKQHHLIEKSHVIRQDRHRIEGVPCRLLSDGTEYQILNFSAFGLAIQTSKLLPKDTEFNRAQIQVGDIDVQAVDLKLVRQEPGINGFSSAFHTGFRQINIEKLNALIESFKLREEIHVSLSQTQRLPEHFRLRIHEIEEALKHIKEKLAGFESRQKILSRREKEDFEVAVIEVVSPIIHEIIREGNTMLHQDLKKCSEEIYQLGLEYFRAQLKDYIFQSEFADRSFKKPLGYAGDYEMMGLIYRNEDFGFSLFARCMERAMQMHDEPQAVRNRAHYLVEKLTELVQGSGASTIKVLSVACGPAYEMELLLRLLTQDSCDKLEIYLLDQDEGALKAAQRNILRESRRLNRSINLNLVQMPIKKLIAGGLKESGFDLIYSAGLFDYFSDPVARLAAEKLLSHLHPRGRLIIGNFDVNTPNYFGMQSLFDWQLILRSEDDLKKIYSFPQSKLRIEREKLGINLFCILGNS